LTHAGGSQETIATSGDDVVVISIIAKYDAAVHVYFTAYIAMPYVAVPAFYALFHAVYRPVFQQAIYYYII
jgi:hypothetical protein